jgi:hypothetical protein
MELNLQPRAQACFVSGQPFQEGDRVQSVLARTESGSVVRYDVLESQAAALAPEGFVACRWVQAYKPPAKGENAERNLKLTAETLFLTLSDPSTEPSPANDRLVRFLALMLERKRLLRQKGRTADSAKDLYEHTKTKQIHEVPNIDLGPEFFVAVREQLSILVGEPKAPAAPSETVAPSETAAAPAEPSAPV